MPAAGYFSKDCNKPINKCPVFLFLNLLFFWRTRQLAGRL